MGLTPRPSSAKLHVIDLVETRLLNDTWYVLRIEFDNERNTLSYFLDGEQIATDVIPDKVLRLDPSIQLWHPDGDSVTGYFDYVAIGD